MFILSSNSLFLSTEVHQYLLPSAGFAVSFSRENTLDWLVYSGNDS